MRHATFPPLFFAIKLQQRYALCAPLFASIDCSFPVYTRLSFLSQSTREPIPKRRSFPC
eukprot:m.184501 g.184501  ORF g.184501 m.184501 type:complete len:59 (+) comp39322_c0_seq6:585-761(+)